MKKINQTRLIKKASIAGIILLLIINIPVLLFFIGGCAVGYVWFQLHQSTHKHNRKNISSVW